MAAELYHGDPLMVDHTPGADVTAGDMILIGSYLHVAHRDIKANELGAMAFPSDAVYRITLAADASFSVGDLVTVNPSTGTTGAGANFGPCVQQDVDEAAGDKYVYAVLTGLALPV